MALRARYDDIAEWYDETMAVSELGLSGRAIVLRLLGPGPGRLLDVGCGGGSPMLAFAEAGWTPAGVDVSPEQLRLARERGRGGVQARARGLPVGRALFGAPRLVWAHPGVGGFG